MADPIHDFKFGAVLITSWFAIALSGVVLLQAYTYFRGKPKQDHRIFSVLVSNLFRAFFGQEAHRVLQCAMLADRRASVSH